MRRVSPYNVLNQQMKPREFCRRWLNSTEYDEEERGYREKCVKLLARVLKVAESTIQRWGPGLDFERMPEQYEATLAYADIIRVMIETTHGQTDLIPIVLEVLEGRQ